MADDNDEILHMEAAYQLAVEGAHGHHLHQALGCHPTRLRISTTLALIMAILGSSVLPVSYAFASTGIGAGLAISLVRAILSRGEAHATSCVAHLRLLHTLRPASIM
jgi:hypothetical protein